MSSKTTKKTHRKQSSANHFYDILIVDGDVEMRETLHAKLSEDGYRVAVAETVRSGKARLLKKFYHVIFLDLKRCHSENLRLLKDIKEAYPETIVMIFAEQASLENAITALNEGAFAYFKKPLNVREVKISLQKALSMQQLSFENAKLLQRLQELSLKDPLTELYNYRYLVERLALELSRARRYISPLSIVMMDLDYFKSVNDVYAHAYGDKILKEFAAHLGEFVRGSDTVVRQGGDEFVILLPETNREGTMVFAERLLESVQKHVFDPKGKQIRLKISIGVSSFPEDGQDVCTAYGLLSLADEGLRRAKALGGNRLSTAKEAAEKAGDMAEKNAEEDAEALRKKLSQMANRANQSFVEAICAFAKTIEAKDYDTHEHAEETVFIVSELGRRLGLSQDEIEKLKHAALLHDLGKVGIPDDILLKKSKLTKDEYEIIKKHPRIGAEIIRPIHFLRDLVPLILYHHERFDGLGYNSGLKGQAIPIGARILAIADVYQALVADRPYRKALGKKEALKIIEDGIGTHFDPDIANLFLKLMQAEALTQKAA